MRVRVVLVLASLTLCFGSVGARATEFGLNDVFEGRKETADYIRDLGVSWILRSPSSTKDREGEAEGRLLPIREDRRVWAKARTKAWFVINVESKDAFTDGKLIGSGWK